MSRIRDFFIQIPKVCGVKSPAWGKMNELAFDHEVANKSSEFSGDGQTVSERIAPAFGFMLDPLCDSNKAMFARDLAELAASAYALNSKGLGSRMALDMLADKVGEAAPDYPDVTALLSVSEATTLGNWA